jgi:hypothetical protein
VLLVQLCEGVDEFKAKKLEIKPPVISQGAIINGARNPSSGIIGCCGWDGWVLGASVQMLRGRWGCWYSPGSFTPLPVSLLPTTLSILCGSIPTSWDPGIG